MLEFQICELTYEKQIDFSTVDLKKLKVKDLKKILSEWDEVGKNLSSSPNYVWKLNPFQECDGCLEKGDFIKRIEELKPKHVRTELWRDLPSVLTTVIYFWKGLKNNLGSKAFCLHNFAI